MSKFLIDEDMLNELREYIKAGDTESALYMLHLASEVVADNKTVLENLGGYFTVFRPESEKPIALFDRAQFACDFTKMHELEDLKLFYDGTLGDWLKQRSTATGD